MQYGVCGNTDTGTVAVRHGYDYVEMTVGSLLKPLAPEEEFHGALEAVRAAEISVPATNCFLPGDLKVTGPDVDDAALLSYVTTTMQRAEQAGVRIIVFGSGGARHIPDDFDREKAHDQIVAFCRATAPVAHDHGVTVVVEPLNLSECNVLTTVGESADLVNEVAHPGLRLLVDAYHLMRDNDSYDDIVKHGDLLAHAHIATVPDRLAPGAEACDLSHFFRALAEANYTGRLSFEGGLSDAEKELPTALAIMRECADASKSDSA